MNDATTTPELTGFHHVTAIAGDARVNHDFYTEALGLRLVKKTINFDDPTTYHLYFGDDTGRPGSLVTFFPLSFPGARRGTRGRGQATALALLVAPGSLDFWRARLDQPGVYPEDITERFGEPVLRFQDPDGLRLELVASPRAERLPPRETGSVPAEAAIRGLAGATIHAGNRDATAALLTAGMGLRELGEDAGRSRYDFGAGDGSGVLDLVWAPDEPRGVVAVGSVHHLAFRVADDAAQVAWQERLGAAGMNVTPVQDRNYFHSIYFREPSGTLFELATDPPGMLIDETAAALGSGLRLPPWLEPHRAEITAGLPALG